MRAFLFAFALLAAACGQTTQEAPADQVEVAPAGVNIVEPWAAPTPGGVDVSAGYLTIANTGGAEERLLSASSPRASRVEIHEVIEENGVMRMRASDAVVILPGGEAVLAPGGMHLMFFDVSQPFTEGEEIPVELRFENAGTVNVSLPVRRAAAEHGH